MKRTYRIQNRITKEWAFPKAESFQEACEAKGWFPSETYCDNIFIGMNEFIKEMKESVNL
jgi:hypothetical protein